MSVDDDAWTALVYSNMDEAFLDAKATIEASIGRSLTDEEEHTLALRYAAKAEAGQRHRFDHADVLTPQDLVDFDIPGMTANAGQFVEQLHPRGQPENAGQFAEKAAPKTATGKTMTRGGAAPIPQEHVGWLREHGVKKFPAKDASNITFHRDVDHMKGALMTWRDGAGRLQAAYSEKFIQQSAEAKWERIRQFEPHYDAIVSAVHEALATTKVGSPEHQAALVAAVIADTGLRPGSDESARMRHYGVTTLEWRHVAVAGHKAVLTFTGKSGERNRAVITEPRLVRALSDLERLAGDDEKARVFPDVDPDAVRELLPEGMKVKDFRTIKAAKVARAELAKVKVKVPLNDPPAAKKVIAKVLLDVSKKVATALNNTPTVARSSYIPPEVFESWVRSIGGSHLMVVGKNAYDEFEHGANVAFVETEHPRGQPDNAGQFSAKPVKVAKPAAAPAQQRPQQGEPRVDEEARPAIQEPAAIEWKSATPEQFIALRSRSKRPGFLSPLQPDDIKGHKLIVSADGTVGCAISPEGDLQNVFNNGGPKGAARHVIKKAIELGARTGDCYDGFLPTFYESFGFREVGRMTFNPAYAEAYAKAYPGQAPDVVFFTYRPDAPAKTSTRRYADHEWETAKEDSRRAAHP